MFWNDPNLYSVAFKDIPNFYKDLPSFPTPFLGAMPRYFNPYQVPPTYFTPPVAPQFFTPQLPPTYFTPPVTPFMHTPPTTPFINPMLTPYNYTLPYMQGYRPFGL
jgi:hypothetical protein